MEEYQGRALVPEHMSLLFLAYRRPTGN